MASSPDEHPASRLLVLGAGRHQTPLIRRAEARGIEVVVADYLPDSPGKAYATHSTMVDALDVDAVCAVAERFAVNGVVTTGTDQPVVTMAEVARRFGLPEIVSPETARVATDKRCMKDVLGAAGVRMPRHVVVGEVGAGVAALEQMQMPAVVKPTDSQGQRGTSLVEGRRDFTRAVEAALAASRRGEVIIEEFVDGFEVTASAWVADGRVQTLMVTDRVTYNPPPAIGIALQHVHPSRHAAPVLAEIRSMLEQIRSAYGVERGPMYVQMLVAPSGTVHLVEAACRVGGGHEISLIPIVCGVDLRDRLIDLALTGTCEPFSYEYPGTGPAQDALVNFLIARPGTIAAQTGMRELVDDGTIDEGAFYHPIGYEQGPIVNGQGRVGYFIARADTRAALAERARAAFERLSMRSTCDEEMLFWPEAQWTRG
jgi:biotin carboxylase